MNASCLDVHMQAVQAHFQALSQALRDNDLESLHMHSTALQARAIEILHAADKQPSAAPEHAQRKAKITQLARESSLLRENLLRRSAQVERMLHVLVPSAAQQATYAPSTTPHSAPYATAMRPSGQLKTLYA